MLMDAINADIDCLPVAVDLNLNGVSSPVAIYSDLTKTNEIIDDLIKQKWEEADDEPFFVCDLGVLPQLYALWNRKLPRVHPHYAVKVNDEAAVIQTLARLGAGFDCASKNEIKQVLDLNIDPERIIYAHPCKQLSHLKFAHENGITRVTFDNEDELHKICSVSLDTEVILRIQTDDSTADWGMGRKYGCDLVEGRRLVKVAQTIGLNVIGVSFHVGSGCRNPDAFRKAISDAKLIFDYAALLGMPMSMLDIGGGFLGSMSRLQEFELCTSVIRDALDEYFPVTANVQIIAEPGRYFAMAPFMLCTSVIAVRKTAGQEGPMYYMNDGKYGSLTWFPLEGDVKFRVVTQSVEPKPMSIASVWGPTCCGTDCVFEKIELPELEVGDTIVFEEMGAYSLSNATVFNGFDKAKVYYFARSRDLSILIPSDV